MTSARGMIIALFAVVLAPTGVLSSPAMSTSQTACRQTQKSSEVSQPVVSRRAELRKREDGAADSICGGYMTNTDSLVSCHSGLECHATILGVDSAYQYCSFSGTSQSYATTAYSSFLGTVGSLDPFGTYWYVLLATCDRMPFQSNREYTINGITVRIQPI